jgi:hypothetical protein
VRVKVWEADGQTYMGEGTFLGTVTAYLVQMPDGCLLAGLDAEVPPDPTDIPEGGCIIVVPDMPKIQLDEDDMLVYGCQVYWKPVKRIPDFSEN